MEKMQELIEAPLSREELAVRYRDLCEDPLFANVPGKIELDLWGRTGLFAPDVAWASAKFTSSTATRTR